VPLAWRREVWEQQEEMMKPDFRNRIQKTGQSCMVSLRRLGLGLVNALCVASSLVVIAHAGHALAQEYPARTIRIVVPFPPGGGNDVLGRMVAQRLSAKLGQSAYVDNKAGAGGNIGTKLVAHSPPDGYTLTLGHVANMAITPLLGDVGYDPLTDFAPISMVAQGFQVLVVNPKLPARTLQELVALAKSKPGALNYASAGIGSIMHLVGELFKLYTGTDIVHVPFNGTAPAANAVVAGQTDMLFGGVVSSLPLVRSGRLRALAVTSPTRSDAAPDIPTARELGYPEIEASSWYGLFAPAGTPAEIIQRLNAEVVALSKSPEYRAQLQVYGQEAISGTPAQLAQHVRTEYQKWARVIKSANIKAN